MTVPAQLDHLVLGTPDVEATSAWIEAATGVRPSVGGPHPGRGTHNVLCSFGPSTYLEIIGPDPDQPEPGAPRPFGVDDLTEPRLVTWCARPADIDSHVEAAAGTDVEYSAPEPMSRQAPSGRLDWRLAVVVSGDEGGIVPFVIDWGTSTHPAATAAVGLHLESLTATHPAPEGLAATFEELAIDLELRQGDRAGLVAVVAGPTGRVQLGA